jgi:hypothetical protein
MGNRSEGTKKILQFGKEVDAHKKGETTHTSTHSHDSSPTKASGERTPATAGTMEVQSAKPATGETGLGTSLHPAGPMSPHQEKYQQPEQSFTDKALDKALNLAQKTATTIGTELDKHPKLEEFTTKVLTKAAEGAAWLMGESAANAPTSPQDRLENHVSHEEFAGRVAMTAGEVKTMSSIIKGVIKLEASDHSEKAPPTLRSTKEPTPSEKAAFKKEIAEQKPTPSEAPTLKKPVQEPTPKTLRSGEEPIPKTLRSGEEPSPNQGRTPESKPPTSSEALTPKKPGTQEPSASNTGDREHNTTSPTSSEALTPKKAPQEPAPKTLRSPETGRTQQTDAHHSTTKPPTSSEASTLKKPGGSNSERQVIAPPFTQNKEGKSSNQAPNREKPDQSSHKEGSTNNRPTSNSDQKRFGQSGGEGYLTKTGESKTGKPQGDNLSRFENSRAPKKESGASDKSGELASGANPHNERSTQHEGKAYGPQEKRGNEKHEGKMNSNREGRNASHDTHNDGKQSGQSASQTSEQKNKNLYHDASQKTTSSERRY